MSRDGIGRRLPPPLTRRRPPRAPAPRSRGGDHAMTADHRMFSGATVMAACACGTASGLASMATRTGLSTAADAIYPVIVGIGGALFLSSLIGRRAAWLPGIAGVAAFAGAIALAPQSSMHGMHAMT